MVILKANNIYKSFGPEIKVLSDVSLTVNEGDFLSILGASGSGKSTLLTILGGMDKADSGSVIFQNQDLNVLKENKLAKLRRTKLGFVFQFFNLAPYLTVEENILLPLIMDGKNIKQYKDSLDELTDYLKISHLKDKMPAKLSGGEQQRVAIARGLIYQPKIIFLDEPTGNLDSKSATEIMELLLQINKQRQTTIIQVTHSTANAAYGNRTIYIEDGKIVESSEIAYDNADFANIQASDDTETQNNGDINSDDITKS